ncbi:unnamed protein product [Cladocopium goreaui]|uniref:Uncharacterized protein n=1 Tax=Cladocopium goreaui TaxID=2562237 RepID=A0A9P1FHZ9_9DINO|nr:unnamed protein product [Cladocopium goreaui]
MLQMEAVIRSTTARRKKTSMLSSPSQMQNMFLLVLAKLSFVGGTGRGSSTSPLRDLPVDLPSRLSPGLCLDGAVACGPFGAALWALSGWHKTMCTSPNDGEARGDGPIGCCCACASRCMVGHPATTHDRMLLRALACKQGFAFAVVCFEVRVSGTLVFFPKGQLLSSFLGVVKD